MAVSRRLVRAVVLGWWWYSQLAGMGVIALALGALIVQTISGEDAVVIASDIREVTTTAHVGGRYGYVYDLERKEACPGEVVTVFTTVGVANPAVITVKKPGMLREIRRYEGVRVDNPLPEQVTKGRWNVDTSYNSRCANRTWTDHVSNFEIEVLS